MQESSQKKITILSIDEYSQLTKNGKIRFSDKNRSLVQHKVLTEKTFLSLIKKAPDIGYSSELYVFVSYNYKGQKDYLDIRDVNECNALDDMSAKLLTLEKHNTTENFWQKFLSDHEENMRIYNGSFFLEILSKKNQYNIPSEENLQSISYGKNIGDNIEGLTEQESRDIANFSMTFAYGWKAALTVLRRLAMHCVKENWKNYWQVPSVKDELNNIKATKIGGSILSDEIYEILKPLDSLLSQIEDFPKLPLAYLVIVFHYCGFAENSKEFNLDDLMNDLDILKKDSNDEFVCRAIYLIGQSLHSEQLMKFYNSLDRKVSRKQESFAI